MGNLVSSLNPQDLVALSLHAAEIHALVKRAVDDLPPHLKKPGEKVMYAAILSGGGSKAQLGALLGKSNRDHGVTYATNALHNAGHLEVYHQVRKMKYYRSRHFRRFVFRLNPAQYAALIQANSSPPNQPTNNSLLQIIIAPTNGMQLMLPAPPAGAAVPAVATNPTNAANNMVTPPARVRGGDETED